MDVGVLGKWWTWLAENASWSEVKSVSGFFLAVLFLWAVIGCLRRLKLIREIIGEFNRARGPIWDLRETINDLKRLEPVIRQLGEQMALLDAKVDAARKQVAELQVESISGRTQEAEGAVLQTQPNGSALAGSIEEADKNWEALREYWRRNTRRIEYIIEQIADGRKRLAYDRIPRTRYRRIVHKLQGAKLISAAAANASIELLDLFNSYRPKNQRVPNSVVGTLKLLDKQLDTELVDFEAVVAADADDGPDDDPGAPRPPAPGRDTGRAPRPLPAGYSDEPPVT